MAFERPRKQPADSDVRAAGRPPQQRVRRFALLLGGVIAIFLVSLPWQARQWERARQMRRETATQEAFVRDLATQRAEATQSDLRLRASGGDDVPALLDGARTSLNRGDAARAARLLDQAEQAVHSDSIRENDALLASELAGLFQQTGWIDRAHAQAYRAVQLAPNTLEPLLRLSVIEASLGWQTACTKHARAALALSPGTAEPYLTLALLDQQNGDWEGAEQKIRAADHLRPNDIAIGKLLVANLIGQRRYDDALAAVETLLKAAPADVDLFASRVNARYLRAQNQPGGDSAGIQAVIEEARSVLKIAPDALAMRFLIGKALLLKGDKAGAVGEWEAIRSVRPDYPMLAENLGRLLLQQGKEARGKQLLSEGIAARQETAEYDRLVSMAGQRETDPEKHRALARWCQRHHRVSREILEWEQVLRLRNGDTEAEKGKEAALQLRRKTILTGADTAAPS